LTTGLNGCTEKGAEGEIKAGASPGGRGKERTRNRGQTDPDREQSTHRRRKNKGATGNWEAQITTCRRQQHDSAFTQMPNANGLHDRESSLSCTPLLLVLLKFYRNSTIQDYRKRSYASIIFHG
jgi:hypothetical protein